MVDYGCPGLEGDVLGAGVDQMNVLLPLGSQRPVADDPVLRVENDGLVLEVEVGAQGGHADPQVHHPAVLEFHGQPAGHGLSADSHFLHPPLPSSLREAELWSYSGITQIPSGGGGIFTIRST